MNITRESIGTLNELLKISLNPEDYTQQLESEIKKHQKSMNLPGFRPGHVPVGLVKKRYGKAILIEELNKIVSQSLDSYINENQLDLLGSPIPQTSDDLINNWDEPGNFEFNFEIGLAPQFSLTLPPAKNFNYYEIEVEEDKIDQYVDDIRRKYGKFSNPETADINSILYGDFEELDATGNVVEGGIKSKSTLSLAAVKDPESLKLLEGTKKGDVVKINVSKAFANNQDEISHMLNLPADKAAAVPADFNYSIESVNLVEKAEMNQEFFDKIYGEGAVTNEAEFREKVRAEIAGMYTQESDLKLKHDLEDYFIDEMSLKLPDEFLKKWLQTAVEKPLTEEQVEKEYNGYSRSMKLRLIENRIFRDQQMNITQEEVNDMARQYILHQFAGYTSGLNDELMNSLITRYLEKRENVERIIETLSDRKVFNYLKTVVKTDSKKVKYDEFVNIVKSHHHH